MKKETLLWMAVVVTLGIIVVLQYSEAIEVTGDQNDREWMEGYLQDKGIFGVFGSLASIVVACAIGFGITYAIEKYGK